MNGIDDQWQLDLADLQSLQKYNDGYRYLLIYTDVLSKYAWAIPLKNKIGSSLVEACKKILSSGRKPTNNQTDQVSEFKTLISEET